MEMQQIREGDVSLLVHAFSEKGYTPSVTPVFYNPHMELNRDVTVAAIAAWIKRKNKDNPDENAGITYLDAMAASGIRGIRVAKEIGVNVTLNDWGEEACKLILENVELNQLSSNSQVSRKSANVLMHEKKFDIIDLDPFGSPAPFLDAAASSAKGLLAVTATDTAPLCGAHLNSGMRKYSSVPLNTEYHSEMGARVLLGYMARVIAMHEKSMVPLLTHATRHYVRTYVQLKNGAKAADKSLREVGFIAHCPSCGMVDYKKGLTVQMEKSCPFCKKEVHVGGPLWLGSLHEQGFCEEILLEMEERPLGTKDASSKMLEVCKNELDVPMFYDQHKICKQLGISAKPIEELLERIRESGFEASRTHFSGTSFKSDANYKQIKQIVRNY
ncbi:tRNA (guanine26-N2/guanine27-N2)-dimethyltransferase [Methanohalophilus levihalophilus]|uniref:tRNA (guanine(10)-N(2))-dimethyltransferase n=1 Tax=Methanohalophilus levihalophilus TaxID=1431282 RepID=UPI001AE52A1F|nr:tRNA (guanine(10)-N(2))-dimethyltransferase [Methanohalophilus levihalophilus]MBP2029671.1 tRNA (guanine26-N2/guanine27-N2)-dimethyltransferase [Methanohalophilus levihalophilus]